MTTNKKINWDLADIRAAKKAIRAIDHKFRQRCLDYIAQEGPVTVTQIYVAMRQDQSVCSQHLAILRRAGLLNWYRQGKFIYYEVNEAMVGRVQETMKLFAV